MLDVGSKDGNASSSLSERVECDAVSLTEPALPDEACEFSETRLSVCLCSTMDVADIGKMYYQLSSGRRSFIREHSPI